jgi:hypothetical protein
VHLTRPVVAAMRAAFQAAVVSSFALPLALLAAAAPGSAPEVLLATARVERAPRQVVVRTVVSLPASRALERRYRTTLRYRCGGTWQLALRTATGQASATLYWRYPARLAGRRCALEVRVAGPGGSAARSAGTVRL